MTNRRKIVLGTVLFFTLICTQLVYPQTAQAKVKLSPKSITMLVGNTKWLDLSGYDYGR